MYALMPWPKLSQLLATLRHRRHVVALDRLAGTLVVYEGPAVILRALAKSTRGNWIVRFLDGPTTHWTPADTM